MFPGAMRRTVSAVWTAGSTIRLADLAAALAGTVHGDRPSDDRPAAATSIVAAASAAAVPSSLREASDTAETAFAAAIGCGDAQAAASAVLTLEQAIVDWSADTTQGDDLDHARRTLRALVVRLGDVAREGVTDPRDRIGPFVALLLARRDAARDARDWPAADAVRDGLSALGVQVRDTPDGVEWHLVEA